jgi:flagellin
VRELENVPDVDYGTRAANIFYNPTSASKEAMAQQNTPADDAAMAAPQEPLRGKLADIGEGIRNSNAAISLVQTFDDALADIKEKLASLEELTNEIGKGSHSAAKQVELQEELDHRTGEINDIVENTEYNGNKLLSTAGRTVSIRIRNGSAVDIAPKDLSIDIEGLDFTTSPDSLLKRIKAEIEAIKEFEGFLLGVRERLEDVTTSMQFELEDVMQVEGHIADFNMATELGIFTLRRVTEEAYKSLRGQVNIKSSKAVQLLSETGERLSTRQDIDETPIQPSPPESGPGDKTNLKTRLYIPRGDNVRN